MHMTDEETVSHNMNLLTRSSVRDTTPLVRLKYILPFELSSAFSLSWLQGTASVSFHGSFKFQLRNVRNAVYAKTSEKNNC